MYLNLRTQNFRNLDFEKLDFSPSLNLFVGENGHGKTNILEALCLATQARSFRFTENETLIRSNQNTHEEQAWIGLEAQNAHLDYQINVRIQAKHSQGRTEGAQMNILLNEKKANSVQLGEIFTNVIFSPESLNSIKESADSRRHLVDEFLMSASANDLASYKNFRKALQFRNKILKAISLNPTQVQDSVGVLESFNEKFLLYATDLTLRRIKILTDVLPDFQQSLKSIFATENPQYAPSFPPEGGFSYLISGEEKIHISNREIHNSMRNRMEELKSAEYSSGTSLVGPHRHDLKILYNGKDSRFYCSQGQQRSLIIAFKLAQIMYHRKLRGQYPALMLDDVLSELDEGKRIQLVRFLQEIETQVFITTTDVRLPDEFKQKQGQKKSQIVFVSNGKIRSPN